MVLIIPAYHQLPSCSMPAIVQAIKVAWRFHIPELSYQKLIKHVFSGSSRQSTNLTFISSILCSTKLLQLFRSCGLFDSLIMFANVTQDQNLRQAFWKKNNFWIGISTLSTQLPKNKKSRVTTWIKELWYYLKLKMVL